MSRRSYGQHCAVAKSLDLIGDRWTLLIVRELLDGPRRYADLLTNLAPIATDMLAGRLRDLAADGLVEKAELPKPASGSVYRLTEDGLALDEVVNALARWGRRLVEERTPGAVARPEWLARAVRAHVRADYSGPDVLARLVIPEGTLTLRIGARGTDVLDDGTPADVTLTGAVETLAAALDADRIPELTGAGQLTIGGKPAAIRRLTKVFAAQ